MYFVFKSVMRSTGRGKRECESSTVNRIFCHTGSSVMGRWSERWECSDPPLQPWALLRDKKGSVVDGEKLRVETLFQELPGMVRLRGDQGKSVWVIPVLEVKSMNRILGTTGEHTRSLSSWNSSKLDGQQAQIYITDKAVKRFHAFMFFCFVFIFPVTYL